LTKDLAPPLDFPIFSTTKGWLRRPFFVAFRNPQTVVEPRSCRRRNMVLNYALVFLVIGLIAGVLGFGGLAGASAGMAQITFLLCLAFGLFFVVVTLIRRV
jgi:uncharacterized membrane protein YtjA (UPF0391 family)